MCWFNLFWQWEKFWGLIVSITNEGEKEVGELHFSNNVILVYNPVVKRFKMSYDMQIIVKIPKMVMEKNFCLWYFFNPSFQGLLLDFGKRRRWVKKAGTARETSGRAGGAIMKILTVIRWFYKCYIKTDVVSILDVIFLFYLVWAGCAYKYKRQ